MFKDFLRVVAPLLLFGFSTLGAADLHVILVGDLAARDLKQSIEMDLEKMELAVLNIAYHADMGLKYATFQEGRSLSTQVLTHIRSLDTKEEDVVLFYYSGHGYRTGQTKQPWPNLYFSAEIAGLELDLITQELKNKSAHLVFVMVDCCNSMMADFLAPPLVKGLVSQNDLMKMQQNYRKLFLEADGCVVVASSKAGQSSYSIDSYGGLYTNAFLKSFDEHIRNFSPLELTWELILEQSVEILSHQTHMWGVSQDPIFQVDIR